LIVRPRLLHHLERVLAEGSVEVVTYGDDSPLPDGLHLRRDGAFYRLGVEQVDSTGVTAYRTDLSWERGQTAPDGAAVVAYDDLPESDQRALRLLVFGTEYERPFERPRAGLSMGDVPAPYPDGAADSRLVGAGTTWVRWDDRTYEVEVTTEETTVARRTFELTAEQVAESPDAFRRLVADRYLVSLDDQPEDQRAIVSAAVEEGYEECTPASEPLAALREWLSGRETLPPEYEESWFVAFEGSRYELDITQWVH
jgi:hypothetical protein